MPRGSCAGVLRCAAAGARWTPRPSTAPARRRGAVDVAAFRPAHVERRVAGAHDAGDLHRHRLLADARERVVDPCVVVEHGRALVGRSRRRPASSGGRRWGRWTASAPASRSARCGARSAHRWAGMAWRLRPRRVPGPCCPPPRRRASRWIAPSATPPPAISSASVRQPKAIRRQFFAWTRGEPMRLSHTWPAAWYGVAGCGVSA